MFETKEHYQLYDSSVAFELDVCMRDELQAGGKRQIRYTSNFDADASRVLVR